MEKAERQFKRAVGEIFNFCITKKKFPQYNKQTDFVKLKVVESDSCFGCYFLGDVIKNGIIVCTKCNRTLKDRLITGFCSYPLTNKTKFINEFGNTFVKFVRIID